MEKTLSFMQTMSKVFKQTGQTLQEFAAEIKALDEADRQWYFEALQAEGYTCAPPIKK